MIPSPSRILQKILVDAGHGVLISVSPNGEWPIFTNQMPDRFDSAMQISDTQAMDDGRIMRTGKKVLHPGLQILLRNLSDSAAYNKIAEIYAYLETVKKLQVIVDAVTYEVAGISPKGNPTPIGWEGQEKDVERKRFLYSMNMTITYGLYVAP